MYIAIRGKETCYIGVTAKEDFFGMAEEDLILEDNMCIAKIHGKKGAMLAWDASVVGEVLSYDGKLFEGEITLKSILKEVVPKIQAIGRKYGKVTEKKEYKGTYIIVTTEKIYTIESDFTVKDIPFCSSSFCDVAKGSYLMTENLPAVERILDAYRTIERCFSLRLFPIGIYDVRTGKRRLYER